MASRFEHPVEMFRCRIPDAGTGRGGFGVEADIKSPKTEFVRRLSLSLILSFFKSSNTVSPHRDLYTHTHKVVVLLLLVARTRKKKKREKERKREREREFFFNRTRDSQKKKTITRGRIETSSSSNKTQHTTQQRSNEKAEQK